MSWDDLLGNSRQIKPVNARFVRGYASEGSIIKQKKTADMKAYMKAYRDREEYRKRQRERMRALRASRAYRAYRLKDAERHRERYWLEKKLNAERL